LSIIRNHILRSNGIVLSWLTPIGADRPTSSTTISLKRNFSEINLKKKLLLYIEINLPFLNKLDAYL